MGPDKQTGVLNLCCISARSKRFTSSAQCHALGLSLLLTRYWGLSRLGLNLSHFEGDNSPSSSGKINFHGATPPLTHTPSWRHTPTRTTLPPCTFISSTFCSLSFLSLHSYLSLSFSLSLSFLCTH
jgi:hypothetical protein